MILHYRHAYTNECLYTRRADAAPAVGTIVRLPPDADGMPEPYKVIGITEYLPFPTTDYYSLTHEAGPDVDVILEEVR